MKDEVTGLWVVQRRTVAGPNGLERVSAIFPLVNIILAVELVPVYGQKIMDMVNHKTSQEHYSQFYLNSFTDKEMFHSLPTEL